MFLKSQIISFFLHCDPGITGTTLVNGVLTANLQYCKDSQAIVSNLAVSLLVGPLAFYYVWTIVEWWRGKDY